LRCFQISKLGGTKENTPEKTLKHIINLYLIIKNNMAIFAFIVFLVLIAPSVYGIIDEYIKEKK
jgi:hypothetical protein